MNINNPSSPSAVWTVTPRTLTGLGGAITTNLGTFRSTLANGSSAFFLAPANTMQLITIVGQGLASVTWAYGIGNGTAASIGVLAASGASFIQTFVSSSTIGAVISNSGTIPGTYSASIISFST